MVKHLPYMPTLHLQYLCFVFVLQQTHFNWVGQGRSRWSSLCQDAAKPVRRPGNSRRGPRARNALSIVWQMARRSLVLFRASYVSLRLGLRNATIQAINAKMDHKWTNGSAVPVDVLVNPINPAHSLVVVFDQERLANVHPFPIISTIIWFSGLGI